MAASTLPKPGTKFGPCKMDCTHKDCAETRAMAASECAGCHKAIGYGVRFYRVENNALMHALCFEEAIEREMIME